jgi:hypothetical protein
MKSSVGLNFEVKDRYLDWFKFALISYTVSDGRKTLNGDLIRTRSEAVKTLKYGSSICFDMAEKYQKSSLKVSDPWAEKIASQT